MKTADNPKVFISYSWSGPEHENFVEEIAKKLIGDGVDVVFDKWELKEGQDTYAFMEKMVTDAKVSKVLVFSDEKYAAKADVRKGGVGTETQIISSKVYKKATQEKFIPIVCEFDGEKACLPTFLQSRKYINFSDDSIFLEEYDTLLRNIYRRPQYIKPEIGKAPAYLFEDNPKKGEVSFLFRHLKDAIKKEKIVARSLSKEFLDQLFLTLETMRISDPENIDDQVLESISTFKPSRDQFISYVQLLCDCNTIDQYKDDFFKFFERLLALDGPTVNMRQSSPYLFDNYKYINMELFLYFITCLIKSRKIDVVDSFLTESYLIERDHATKEKNYCNFNNPIDSLDKIRNEKLKTNRLSIAVDLLKASADLDNISFPDIMQTDFILCLRCAFDDGGYFWLPRTLIYACAFGDGKIFELFLRSKSSTRYFNMIQDLLKVESKEDFKRKFKELKSFRIGNQYFYLNKYLNPDTLYE